jgi:predicted ABC-type ATPase
MNINRRSILLCIAGLNGSGKSTVTIFPLKQSSQPIEILTFTKSKRKWHKRAISK